MAEFLLEARRAVATPACPGQGAVVVAATAAIMCILDSSELEVLLPVGLFFLQRRGAIADFHPARGQIGAQPSFAHVAQVLAFSNGAFTERAALDGFEESLFTARFHASAHEISHMPILRQLSAVGSNRMDAIAHAA